jgi:hypothetical protein
VCDKTLLKELKFEVKDGCLYLGVGGGVSTDLGGKVFYYLGLARPLETIIVSGDGTVGFEGDFFNQSFLSIIVCSLGFINIKYLITPNFMLKIAGKGGASIRSLQCQNVSLQITGKGKIKIENGNAEKQHIRISGEGDVDSSGLTSTEGDVGITGKGNVTVSVENQLVVMTDSDGINNIINKINSAETVFLKNDKHFYSFLL